MCPQILFVGSSLNFSGTTSSDVRHTANEIKSSAGSSVQGEALLDYSEGVKGYLESPFASLNVAYTVKSEEQGEHSGRILFPPLRVLSTLAYNRPDPCGLVIGMV